MKGLSDLVRQAQIMQKKMAKLQEELAEKTVEASAGGGMVTAVAYGDMRLASLSIDPSVVDSSDVEMLQDLVLSAANEALKKAKEMSQGELSALTGGLQLPGMF